MAVAFAEVPQLLTVHFAWSNHLPVPTGAEQSDLLRRASDSAEAHLGLRVGWRGLETFGVGTLASQSDWSRPIASPNAAEQQSLSREAEISQIDASYRGQIARGVFAGAAGRAALQRLLTGLSSPERTECNSTPATDAWARISGCIARVHVARAATLRHAAKAQFLPAQSASAQTDAWPAFDAPGVASMEFWAHLAKSSPADVIITNLPILDTASSGSEIHSSLRGGLAHGVTVLADRKSGRTLSVLSTFGFQPLALPPPLVQTGLDGGRWTSSAAALLTHELGHGLLRLGHPFDNVACVMNPPELFDFEKWLAGLDPTKCPLGSAASMRQGAIRFEEETGVDPRP